jgi:hypothetical protein
MQMLQNPAGLAKMIETVILYWMSNLSIRGIRNKEIKGFKLLKEWKEMNKKEKLKHKC